MDTRLQQLTDWLKQAGIQLDSIAPASADASFRRYFRVTANDTSWVAMDAPPEHESCREFIDISRRLLRAGLKVPAIKASDTEQGFLLLTDLGTEQFLQVVNETNADTLYKGAIDSLVLMQAQTSVTGLPDYDETLLLNEMKLFDDWLVGHHLQQDYSADEQSMIDQLQDLLIENALQQPRVFVHRDYHSRNLMTNGTESPGILDYQDAVHGPFCYDIVSLLKDCYIDWPVAQRQQWLQYFIDTAEQAGIGFDRERVQRWFDLMGVQRQLKASGIFCRLYHRDGKDGYLKDIPRTLRYIVQLQDDYAELNPVSRFIQEKVLPVFEREGDQCAP